MRFCSRCEKYDDNWETFTFGGEVYYLCYDCSIDVMKFIEKLNEEEGEN